MKYSSVKCKDKFWYIDPVVKGESYVVYFKNVIVFVVEADMHLDTLLKSLPFKIKILGKTKGAFEDKRPCRAYIIEFLSKLDPSLVSEHKGKVHVPTRGEIYNLS